MKWEHMDDQEPPRGVKLIVWLDDFDRWDVAYFEGKEFLVGPELKHVDAWQINHWMIITDPRVKADEELRCRDCRFFNYTKERSGFNGRMTYSRSCTNDNVTQKNHCPSDQRCKWFKMRSEEEEHGKTA